MSNPNIPSANAERNRKLFRTLYYIAMIAYWLILWVIGSVSSILDNNSFFLDLDLHKCSFCKLSDWLQGCQMQGRCVFLL